MKLIYCPTNNTNKVNKQVFVLKQTPLCVKIRLL